MSFSFSAQIEVTPQAGYQGKTTR